MTRIVHLSPSVLAGAPGMLAAAQRHFAGHEAIHLRCGDWGRARDRFSPTSVPLAPGPEHRQVFLGYVRRADIIHVHNGLPAFAATWLAESGVTRNRPCIYHIHSFEREPPIYGDLSADWGIPWAARVAVAQAHPRMYPDFQMMPNCLFRLSLDPARRPWLNPGTPALAVFSPSTGVGGRFGRKTTPAFARAWRALGRSRAVQTLTVQGLAPERLLRLRATAEFGLDEVVTGGFHLVSYETMASGGVAVNGADHEARACLQLAARAPTPPPFLRAAPATLVTRILDLAADPARLTEQRRLSHAYFWEWLAPGRIVALWDDLYREVGT